MKILLANKFITAVAVTDLEKMLKAKGHEVAVYAMQYQNKEKITVSQFFP